MTDTQFEELMGRLNEIEKANQEAIAHAVDDIHAHIDAVAADVLKIKKLVKSLD